MIKEIILQIPESYRPAVITSTATLTGAFVGSIVAQYFSHKMTLRRENQKYYKECYQKFYAPILFEVYAYIEIYTHFRRGHDVKENVNEDEIYKKIFSHIEANLMYATPLIMSEYNAVKMDEYQDDLSGFFYRINELSLLESFLKELLLVARKSNTLKKHDLKGIMTNIIYLRVWIILTEYFGDPDSAARVVSYKFYYSPEKLNNKQYRKIMNYFCHSTLSDKVNMLLYDFSNHENSLVNKLGKWAYQKYSKRYNSRNKIENIDYLYKLLVRKVKDREMLVKMTNEFNQ